MNDQHLMEDFVVESVIKHLESNGFMIKEFAKARNHGIDVHAESDAAKILVEAKGAKGNPSNGPVTRSKFDIGQIRDHFGKAIVKVLELRNIHPQAELWIAHPDTADIRRIVDPLKAHLMALGVKCVYVLPSGEIS